MSTYRVKLVPSAIKQLASLPMKIRNRISRRIDTLAAEPRPQGCVKLKGADDIWRIRVGDHRVLYQVSEEEILVLVLRIGKREQVYRK